MLLSKLTLLRVIVVKFAYHSSEFTMEMQGLPLYNDVTYIY